jgi:hypothetical protein
MHDTVTETERSVEITDFEREALLSVLNDSESQITIANLRWMSYLVIRLIKRSGLIESIEEINPEEDKLQPFDTTIEYRVPPPHPARD